MAISVLAAGFPAAAHQDPYVTFICRFVDAQGRAVSGLSVSLETGIGRNESEIKAGEAEVAMGFGRNYAGSLKLRVFDRKRRPVPLKVSGTSLDSERVFPYVHRVGENLLKHADLQDFLNEGTEYPGDDGKVHATRGAAREFHLDWSPELISREEAEEEKAVEKRDRDIDRDLHQRLSAIRAQRAAK